MTINVIGKFQPLNNECLIFIIFLVIDDISVVSICIGFFFFFLIYLFLISQLIWDFVEARDSCVCTHLFVYIHRNANFLGST